jgi:hypothetical protein
LPLGRENADFARQENLRWPSGLRLLPTKAQLIAL